MTEFTPENTTVLKEKKEVSSSTFSFVKVFLWLGLGLLLTGVVALGMPDLLTFIVKNTGMSAEGVSTLYISLMVTAGVLMIPSIIIMNLKSWKPKSVWMTISYVVYTLAMGVLLSNTFMFVFEYSLATDISFIRTISTAFLITAGCFLLMGLFAFLTKKNLNILLPLILTLLVGSLVISLVNFFIGSTFIYWMTDFIIFGVILLVTAVDLYRIKKMVTSGAMNGSNNLALYAAYMLYVDFINIFIRVLFYVLQRSRK